MKIRFALVAISFIGSLAWAADPVATDPTPEEPRVVSPLEVGVSKLAPDLTGKTIAGEDFQLSRLANDSKGVVVAMTSTSCPLCKKFLPTLIALEKAFADQGIRFVFINTLANAKPEDLKAAAGQVKGPYLHDAKGALASLLNASSTTEVILLDSRRTIIYRGAVDDQYGLGYSHDEPKRTFLKNALAAHLAGKLPEVRATTAPGCVLERDPAATVAPTNVTYHNQIARLVQAHCLECHRTGGVGPFSLETRDDILAQKAMIKKVVTKGTMPPWSAAKAKGTPSMFINDRSLSETEKAELIGWLDAGGPEGNKADAPLTRTFPKEWNIGKPDLVLKLPNPVKVKATGTMPYQKIAVETGFTEDKWIQAVEIRPSAKSVVHHVLAFPLPPGTDIPPRAEAQGQVAAYVPGNTYQIYPTGYAKKLNKGARLLFQMHYTPNGTETEDQTEIAFIFAKEKPHTEVRVLGLVQSKLEIKPGDDNYTNSASITVPWDVSLLAFAPHMHVRGKSCKYEITVKGQPTKTLLDIPHYDFNWQHQYVLNEPLVLKAGTNIKFTATFDNSEKNPANPDPKATVRWGPQTTDEMLIGYVEFFIGLPKK